MIVTIFCYSIEWHSKQNHSHFKNALLTLVKLFQLNLKTQLVNWLKSNKKMYVQIDMNERFPRSGYSGKLTQFA